MSALDDDYKKAGFGGRLEFGSSPALLIVDVCRAYVDPASALYAGPDAETALQNNVALRDRARELGLPVIFTEVKYHPSGVDGGLFFKKVPALKHFVAGHPMAAFLPELTPEGTDTLVTKQYPSAFFGTSLAAMLTSMHVDTLLITGYSTSGCVRASVLDALQNGFVPFVVEDACADRAEGPHASNIFDLKSKYAEIVSTEEALSLMAGGSEFPPR